MWRQSRRKKLRVSEVLSQRLICSGQSLISGKGEGDVNILRNITMVITINMSGSWMKFFDCSTSKLAGARLRSCHTSRGLCIRSIMMLSSKFKIASTANSIISMTLDVPSKFGFEVKYSDVLTIQ